MTAITAAPADNLPAFSLRPTQGQWWDCDFWVPDTERRVSLVAAQMGHHLWTASLRNARTGAPLGHWFFVTLPQDHQPVAVFRTLADREAWLQARWAERG